MTCTKNFMVRSMGFVWGAEEGLKYLQSVKHSNTVGVADQGKTEKENGRTKN